MKKIETIWVVQPLISSYVVCSLTNVELYPYILTCPLTCCEFLNLTRGQYKRGNVKHMSPLTILLWHHEENWGSTTKLIDNIRSSLTSYKFLHNLISHSCWTLSSHSRIQVHYNISWARNSAKLEPQLPFSSSCILKYTLFGILASPHPNFTCPHLLPK